MESLLLHTQHNHTTTHAHTHTYMDGVRLLREYFHFKFEFHYLFRLNEIVFEMHAYIELVWMTNTNRI